MTLSDIKNTSLSLVYSIIFHSPFGWLLAHCDGQSEPVQVSIEAEQGAKTSLGL